MTTTLSELVAQVRRLAADRPDNVYQPELVGAGHRCSYLDGRCTDGTLGCLVGQAFRAAGLTADELQPVNRLAICEALEHLLRQDIDCLQGAHIAWLMSVQNAQDEGARWREAIEVADREVLL
jgi:hypothetical protein